MPLLLFGMRELGIFVDLHAPWKNAFVLTWLLLGASTRAIIASGSVRTIVVLALWSVACALGGSIFGAANTFDGTDVPLISVIAAMPLYWSGALVFRVLWPESHQAFLIASNVVLAFGLSFVLIAYASSLSGVFLVDLIDPSTSVQLAGR